LSKLNPVFARLPRPSLKRSALAILLLGAVLASSGCRTISFYGQALKGQFQIFAHEQPIAKLLVDTNTPPTLRDRLIVLEDLRWFALTGLKLPVDGHYQKYVDVHRPYVVWNVQAAPEFSLQAKTWWYPLVGSLEYRGYFSHHGATNYAAYLRRKGYDVSVGGVEAYSTLGWFKDPILNTFIFEPDADLAEIIFHELGHQRVFARGDTEFNEAFATAVGEEGARRWLRAKGNTGALQDYLAHLERTRGFVHLVMKSRDRLAALYGDERNEQGKLKGTSKNRDVPRAQLRAEKQHIFEEMKQEYLAMKAAWHNEEDYSGWFKRPINNAHLNSVAAYYDLVPGFEQILAENQGDLEKFYTAAEKLAKEPKEQRHAALQRMARTRLERKAARNELGMLKPALLSPGPLPATR
jgi:predicted aminopeptidase